MKKWCCEKIFQDWKENPDTLWYKADEVDVRIRELEKEIERFKRSTQYAIGYANAEEHYQRYIIDIKDMVAKQKRILEYIKEKVFVLPDSEIARIATEALQEGEDE